MLEAVRSSSTLQKFTFESSTRISEKQNAAFARWHTFTTSSDVAWSPPEVNEMEVEEQRREAAPETGRRAARPAQASAMEIDHARSLMLFMPGRQGTESSSRG